MIPRKSAVMMPVILYRMIIATAVVGDAPARDPDPTEEPLESDPVPPPVTDPLPIDAISGPMLEKLWLEWEDSCSRMDRVAFTPCTVKTVL